MKRNSTIYFGLMKSEFAIAATILCLLILMILTATPTWACKGVAHQGYHTTMKMIDPYTGDLFATVTFGEIKEGGIVKMTKSNDISQSPSPYKLRVLPVYYDITTTTDYSGEIRLCVNYNSIGFSDTKKSALRISHLNNNSWEEVETSLDREHDLICGKATSLSHFAIFEDPRDVYGPLFWYHRPPRPGL